MVRSDITPAQRPYKPWGTAEDIFYSRDRILIASGPAGTGKSRAILEKLHYLCCKYPRLRVLIVRATRKSLTEAALYTYEEHVLPEGSAICAGAQRANRSAYHYPNGSMISIAGFDDNTADRVMSTEWDFIFIQEGIELDEETTEKLDMRLRNNAGPYRQLLIDTNPGAPTHYLLKWAQSGAARMIHTRHEDNPRFFDHETGQWTPEGEEYLGSLKRKKGHLLDRYFFGKWVQPEGARWSGLDERVQGFKFREKFPQGIPEGWPVILGGDYGLRAPFAAVWFTVDSDGDIWMFRERYEAGLTASMQAKQIIASTGSNERVAVVRLDPGMWQKYPAHEGPSDRSAYYHYNEELRGDNRFGPIEKGFNQSRMLGEAFLDQLFDYEDDSTPNLHIETDLCPNAWAEFTGAVWPKNKGGQAIKEHMDEVNCPDHAITATIYALYGHVARPKSAKPPLTAEAARIARAKEIQEKDERDFIRANRNRRSRVVL